MKKLLVIFIFIFVLFSCRSKDEKGNIINSGLSKISIGNCQYIIYIESNHKTCSMVHAGDCDNSIHKLKN